MSILNKAVFLSYASQDAEAVLRIAEALRAAGVEVWFDKDELAGGDAWDRKIRGQVATCVLFVPVISAATQARREGYFRIEWKLAAQRTQAFADGTPFLLPVVIDATKDGEALVPEEFRAVQWTRLPGGETPEKFCALVRKLLGGSAVLQPASEAPERGPKYRATPEVGRRVPAAAWRTATAAIVVALATGGYFWLKRIREPAPVSAQSAGAGTRPPTADKPAAPLSPARQLAERASALALKKYNSTADDFVAAEGLLKESLALDQNDAEIWAISSLFNTAIRTRGYDNSPTRREAARSQAERALKLDPNSTEALFALGRWQRDHEPDPTVAEKTFLTVLARAPDHEQALGTLATHYDRTDRFEESIAMFDRAARIPAATPLARYGQYLAYFNRWHFDEAERCVRESVAAEPSANSVTGLAMVLLTARGDAVAAVRALADLPLAHRSEHRAVWMSANAHLVARDPEGALNALRRFSADFIQDNWCVGPTAYWTGRAHAQAGRTAAARIAFESGLAVIDEKLKVSSGNSALHVARGELLAWLGRTEEALGEARTATELASERDRLLWFFSPVRIYAALGRPDDALPWLERFCARGINRIGWPLTPALLRIDPLWDKLRGDVRFQALCVEPLVEEKKPVAEPAPLSEGAQLTARALALFTKTGFTRDDLGPAEDFARRATEKEPANAAAWGVRAGVQAAWILRNWDGSEKRRQETQSLANRALALDANEPEALLALTQVLRAQGASAQVEAHLRRSIAANPNHVRLARSLGIALATAGRVAEGRAVFQELAQRFPRDPLVRYDLSMTYVNFGAGGGNPVNLAASAEQLDAAIALEPFASALLLKAVQLGGWRGDLPAMRATLDQVDTLPLAERSEDRAVCVSMWAGLLERRPERVVAAATLTARTYFDDGVMPLRPKAWSLALAHRIAGKENLARREWQAAEAVMRQRLKDEPANETYQVELAITLAWLEQREEAARLIGAVEPVWREEVKRGRQELLARYHAAAGDAAKVVADLPAAIDHTVFMSRKVIPLDPWWDKVRDAPEFVAALKEAAATK
ncbi:MAG: toll/interleukin-1 receptor domain-containing protein [Opitutaceae bacterium]|nr:toll/interleukin-1 receptor domain-containing protein [Opitutaceae bacterium]